MLVHLQEQFQRSPGFLDYLFTTRLLRALLPQDSQTGYISRVLWNK